MLLHPFQCWKICSLLYQVLVHIEKWIVFGLLLTHYLSHDPINSSTKRRKNNSLPLPWWPRTEREESERRWQTEGCRHWQRQINVEMGHRKIWIGNVLSQSSTCLSCQWNHTGLKRIEWHMETERGTGKGKVWLRRVHLQVLRDGGTRT